MMLLLAGFALIALAIVDSLWTTLWVSGGGGPLSSWAARTLWTGLRKATGEGRTWPLVLAGPIVLVAVVLGWVGLLWIGWTLVFASDPGRSRTLPPESFRTGRVGSTSPAYTLFTLGIGNIVPAQGTWEVVTVVASGSGMLLITLGISYLISVLGAVVVSRAFANSVGAWATTPRTSSAGRGTGNGSPDSPSRSPRSVRDSTPSRSSTSRIRSSTSTMPAMSTPRPHRPSPCSTRRSPCSGSGFPRRAALRRRFSKGPGRASGTTSGRCSEPGSSPPTDSRAPRPSTASAPPGLPTVSDKDFADALASLDERRRSLLGMIEADARTWPPAQP
jgi:hypothetical protein